jgi:hypothetical protein
LLFCVLAAGSSALGQSGKTYTLDWSKVGSGGGQSSGKKYTVIGTISQPDVSYSKGGNYELFGGSWPSGPLCFIGLVDFARFAQFWLQTGSNLPADLDNNGAVDLNDLILFTDEWLCPCYYNWLLK